MMLIKNAMIHVGNGEILKDHDILIEDGIIKKVGKNIDKKDAKIIDASGKEVFPGFIEPMTSMGCVDFSSSFSDHEERSNPITPEMNIKYAFNPEEMELQTLYKRGVTSIGAIPGNSNIVGGQMAVFKTYGISPKKMLVKECVGLKCSVVGNIVETYGEKDMFPQTKMGIFNALKRILREAQEYMDKGEKVEKKDEKNEIFGRVLTKEIPLFVAANTKQEIQSLIDVTKDYDIELVIYSGYQSDRCIEDIKLAGASLILGNLLDSSTQIYNDTEISKIKELIDDGVLVGISSSSSRALGDRETFLWNAIELYKAGIDSEKVVEIVTLNHAKLLGVADKIGSIEEGKEADIVIYTKNPIEYYDARITQTFIRGDIVYADGGEE